MNKCIKCGSYAFNLYKEGVEQGGFCDVHYWQGRAHRAEAALAEPVQEPVAWMGTDIEGNPNKFRLNPFNGGVELYKKPQSVKVWDAEGYDALMQELELWKAAAQRQWLSLTDDERGGILVTYFDAGLWRLSEAIEAKLKEKNT